MFYFYKSIFSGKIKEVLSADLNIPVSKQELKGWASRKVHDNVSYIIDSQHTHQPNKIPFKI